MQHAEIMLHDISGECPSSPCRQPHLLFKWPMVPSNCAFIITNNLHVDGVIIVPVYKNIFVFSWGQYLHMGSVNQSYDVRNFGISVKSFVDCLK